MPAVTPFLWYVDQAERAAELYVSLVPNSRITGITRYPDGGPFPAGTAQTVDVELDGVPLRLFNGGEHQEFTDAVSLFVEAPTQADIDRIWDGLTADGGRPVQCGWLKDPFGMTWQVVPPVLMELLSDPDPARAGRARDAMLGMGKLDIAALRAAADGE